MTTMRSLIQRSQAQRLALNPLGLAQRAGTAVSIAAWLALASAAWADPTGGRVVAGQASIVQNGPNTVIHAGNNAILNFHSFNIAAHESVRFVQPGSTSRVLNRITGPDPSVIAGRLSANGIVYIANPAGVYFTRGAIVNVGGIYAAAGTISNANFLSGSNKFSNLSGMVENQGAITGSAVHLIGQRVANYGSIVAPQGMVALAAGDEVYVGQENGQIFARVSSSPTTAAATAASGAAVTQAGTINASGGQVTMGAGDMYALAIHHTGTTTAREITAQGKERGVVQVSGTMNASNQGAHQTGGTIRVLGDRVGIDGATLDASGVRGGGTILVGGDFQGQGSTQTASRTVVSRGSTLNAEATQQGDGGKVIVWADDTTIYRGNLSVRGGAAGGNGGFAEVSGKENLAFSGGAQTHARAGGQDGTLLLDPRDITIQAGTGPDDPELGDDEILFGDGSPAATTDFIIGTDTLEALTGNILLQAQRDITLLAGADLNLANQTSGESVTFQAGNNINLLASLTTGGGSLILMANDDGAGTATGTGLINIQAPIDTSGGDITLSGAGITFAADLAAGSGIMTFSAPVLLEENTTLTAQGVTFESTVDSASGEFNDLTVNSPSTAFLGSIGTDAPDTALGTLTTNAAGTTLIGGSQVRGQVLQFDDRVVVEEDVTFVGTTSVTFASSLESAEDERRDITVNSPLTTFGDDVGSDEINRLGTLSTDAAGTTTFNGAIVRAERLTIRDMVEIGSDLTISATQAMTFVRSIDSVGGEFELKLEAPAIALQGSIGQTRPLTLLSTSDDSTAFFRGGIITADTVDFAGRLVLNAGMNTVNAATSATFGDINGEAASGGGSSNPDLLVNSPLTTFAGAIGLRIDGALGTLTTDADGMTILDAGSIIAQEVRFNDRVELDQNINIEASQLVRFGNTVNSTGSEQYNLGVVAPQTLFVASVGDTQRLGQVVTDDVGTTVFGGQLLRVARGTFADNVTLTNDLTLDSTGGFRFEGELNSQTGQQRTLTVTAGSVNLLGGVGVSTDGQLGALLTSGAATIGETINTIGDQTYEGAVQLQTNTTINAANVFFESTVQSVSVDRALTVNTSGGGTTRFGGAVGQVNPLASLTTNADGTTVFASGSVTTSGDQLYQDIVVLGSDVTLSGSNIRFDKTVDSDETARALTVNSTGSGFTTFVGAVGGSNALSSLTTNSGGTTRIEGGVVNTTGQQAFNDDVVISVDTVLTGSGVGFGRTLNSATESRALTIRPSQTGITSFGGSVGGLVPLSSLIVAPTITMPTTGIIRIFDSIRTLGVQTYNQRIQLGGDATLTATSVNIMQGVNSTPLLDAGLTVNTVAGGNATLLGSLGGQSILKHLITNSSGSTILGRSQGATENDSVIRTTERITFGNAVVVRDDITMTGGTGISFASTLNSDAGDTTGRDVVLRTNITSPGSVGSPSVPRITFTGDIGGTSALGSLRIGQDLQLTPAVATIGAGLGSGNTPIANYSLEINTRRGFFMGERQKMTVLGDLLIDAGTQAVLSDINALGTLTVNAPEIILQRRPSGVNVAGGPLRQISDPGLDFVARQINFSATPQLVGSGPVPRFGTPTGENVSNNLREFSQREVGELLENQFRAGGNYLDLVASGPAAVNLAEALPGAVPVVFLGGEVGETTTAEAAAREQLAEIGIPTRPDTTTTTAGSPLNVPTVTGDRQALLSFLAGPGLYVDVGGPRPDAGPLAVTVSRLPANVVSRVLASYRNVFTREVTNPETGEREFVPSADHVSKVLSDAWAEYSEQAGQRADGVGFRAFVEAVPTQAEALHYLNGLRRLFGDIGLLGLTPAETRRAREAILDALNVAGMTRAQLETAIVTQQLGASE